jgi:hypothetical protein
MASAMVLWIFSSLHKESWENIHAHNSKNVCGKRRHCDRWFQELKIATWPSESPQALPPSLGASSCLCLYCHYWIKFLELNQYDWLALILPVSFPPTLSLLCPGSLLIIPAGRGKLEPSLWLWVWGLRETTLPIGSLLQKVSGDPHWTSTSSRSKWRSALNRCFVSKWMKVRIGLPFHHEVSEDPQWITAVSL